MQHAGKLRDHYRIGKMLGSGAFGEVRVCVHRESGAQRAVKVLRKSHMDEDEKKRFSKLKDMYKPLTYWWKDKLTELTEKGAMKDAGVKIEKVGEPAEINICVCVRVLIGVGNFYGDS